jgi:hypothetical protein
MIRNHPASRLGSKVAFFSNHSLKPDEPEAAVLFKGSARDGALLSKAGPIITSK